MPINKLKEISNKLKRANRMNALLMLVVFGVTLSWYFQSLAAIKKIEDSYALRLKIEQLESTIAKQNLGNNSLMNS